MEHSMRKRCIQLTIQRAEEQGLDVSANDLVECLFSSSDDISSDDESGDCCLKDLTDNEDQFMSTLDNHSLPSVRRDKRNNSNSNDTNKTHGTQDNGGVKKDDEQFRDNKRCKTTKKSEESWTQFYSTQPKKKKRKAKYVCDIKEKKRMKEERECIKRLNDLTKPMPKKFWYGKKRLY